ncbi:hypothetical protein ALI144C_22745 [Actinosynnema sp. ALI-1.44]|uniref:hypothetical protein n=1 Tax=Actinosynnema sp. ALI-1.44 TaxID=1933779 RepID=UPI00097BF982|nr:hypothetical protein [Actinosynnema sp. ALI-1.44]ONI79606.1 hypothetical protein ALI144C_22745 [Actinosynnema sp. ALI-1.44]
MLIAEARDLLSQTFTATVRRAFIWSVEHHSDGVRAYYADKIAQRPPRNPGHNPLAVPDVPPATVNIRRQPRETASITFTYPVRIAEGDCPVPADQVVAR